MKILETKKLKKYYGKGDTLVKAGRGGPRGGGWGIRGHRGHQWLRQIHLLHMLGGLDRPTNGTVIVDGKDIFSLKDEALTIFRRRKIGFVFQSFNLVPVLTVRRTLSCPSSWTAAK